MSLKNSKTKFFDDTPMREALKLARIAFSENEVPVGAVIINSISGEIIAKAYNMCEQKKNPVCHAEILAVHDALSIANRKTLSECHIYVTLEPCAMCALAISYTRMPRIYYGATDKKFGAIESGSRVFNNRDSSVYVPEVYGGILEEESAELMREFFKKLRSH